MPLKPYSELVQLDVEPYCEIRKGKDDKGNLIDIPYLNWAKCIQLLHENGAQDVWFTPRTNPEHGYLFVSKEVQDKNSRHTGCYFVSVIIHIDDLEFTMDAPLLNGSLVVYDDTLNQLRIANSHARAFVKGVAIRTGLGFSLWVKEKEQEDTSDDLSIHNIYAIKERIERLITARLQAGWEMDSLVSAIGLTDKQFKTIIKTMDSISALEQRLLKL